MNKDCHLYQSNHSKIDLVCYKPTEAAIKLTHPCIYKQDIVTESRSSKEGNSDSDTLRNMRDTNSNVNNFIDAIRPYIGNADNDDLLHAFAEKLLQDEARENRKEHIIEKNTEPLDRLLVNVTSVKEVCDAVLKAKKDKKVLRVAGSEHAPAENIFPDDDGVTLLLSDELRKVEMLKEVEEDGKMFLYCRVGGGCYLGKNPSDSNSTEENGMCYQINAEGYAFGITGGITHQSIGGYMTTGADGGSIQHSFAETIQDIEFVDGNGIVQVASRGSDVWCAFGVSMGLLGVVTAVTFRLGKSFLVKGVQNNVKFEDSYLGPDVNGKSKLKESIETIEYFHLNWFPQKYVQRVMQWTGAQTHFDDIVPFHNTLQKPLAALAASVALLTCNRLLEAKPTEETYKVIGALLRQFVPLDHAENFCDLWNKTLPSDNQAPVDTLIKVDFTELWLPLDQCQTVMDRLQALYNDNQEACGNFATEVYCAKQSPFWLSMAYGRDVVRVDPYWYHFNNGDKRKYYSYVWDALLDLPGARCHWGKYLPLAGQTCGGITFNLAHLKVSYPKMADWLKKRDELDPDQVFVSGYWRGILEIPKKSEKMDPIPVLP